ncbi:uncharacterized protein [Castor canadensis]|uniref:Uncharacterized protein n=2 Tax=Castor canadensis TaxID=51338 RepID=A0AC58L3W2_CASCN
MQCQPHERRVHSHLQLWRGFQEQSELAWVHGMRICREEDKKAGHAAARRSPGPSGQLWSGDVPWLFPSSNQLHPSLSDAGPSRQRGARAQGGPGPAGGGAGPTRERGGADALRTRDRRGTQGAAAGARPRGRESRAVPAAQAGPSPDTDKRTDSRRPTGWRGAPASPAGPRRKDAVVVVVVGGGVSLPGASALSSAPAPWAPPPDRRTAGQWAPGCSFGPAGPGSPGPGPAGGGRLRAEPVAGSRGGGAADGQSQRQTDGRRGKKMATRTAGARCSHTRSVRGACTSLTSSPPPPQPRPPGLSPGARLAMWAGLEAEGVWGGGT